MSLDIKKINSLLSGEGIEVFSVHINTKASEEYIDVKISDPTSDYIWEGTIPYKYRRTALLLKNEEEVAIYLISIRQYFNPELISSWVEAEKTYWKTKTRADVTKPFFDALAKLSWVNPEDFPNNRNPQRRLQDIKELGYTVASKKIGRGYARLLVPLPRAAESGYEQISKKFKDKAVRTLQGTNVYELSSANKAVRWMALVGQETGGLKREPRRLSFPGYAAR